MLLKNKYGINSDIPKTQVNHLNNLIHGLINIHGNKSISSIPESVLTTMDSSSIYRFLSTSMWDDNFLNRSCINIQILF